MEGHKNYCPTHNIGHLVYVEPCPRCWRCRSKQDRQVSALMKLMFEKRKEKINK